MPQRATACQGLAFRTGAALRLSRATGIARSSTIVSNCHWRRNTPTWCLFDGSFGALWMVAAPATTVSSWPRSPLSSAACLRATDTCLCTTLVVINSSSRLSSAKSSSRNLSPFSRWRPRSSERSGWGSFEQSASPSLSVLLPLNGTRINTRRRAASHSQAQRIKILLQY